MKYGEVGYTYELVVVIGGQVVEEWARWQAWQSCGLVETAGRRVAVAWWTAVSQEEQARLVRQCHRRHVIKPGGNAAAAACSAQVRKARLASSGSTVSKRPPATVTVRANTRARFSNLIRHLHRLKARRGRNQHPQPEPSARGKVGRNLGIREPSPRYAASVAHTRPQQTGGALMTATKYKAMSSCLRVGCS